MNKITYEERKAVYYDAIAKYGTQLQMVVALEEMSELQKEICKYMRGNNNLKNLIEEIADVTIMLEQLRLIISENDAVCEVMDSKIERLAARIRQRVQRSVSYDLSNPRRYPVWILPRRKEAQGAN